MSQYNDSASVQLLQVAINSATARAPMLGSLPLDLDPIEGTNDGGPAAVIAFDESKGHVNTGISGLDEPPIASSSDTKFKHGTILVPLIIPSRGLTLVLVASPQTLSLPSIPKHDSLASGSFVGEERSSVPMDNSLDSNIKAELISQRSVTMTSSLILAANSLLSQIYASIRRKDEEVRSLYCARLLGMRFLLHGTTRYKRQTALRLAFTRVVAWLSHKNFSKEKFFTEENTKA